MDGRRYRELRRERLPAPVRGMVECAWRGDVPAGAAAVHVQRVLPDGCMDLLLAGDELMVAGPDTAAQMSEQRPGTSITGLRFRPGRLPALLGIPACELRDRRIALAELTPRTRRAATAASRRRGPAPGDALAELLSGAGGLLRDAEPVPGRPVLPSGALELLRRGGTVRAVADDLGCTTRTLHRHCLDTLGYGPATVRRVLRFRTAADLLHAGVPPAEAAARAGYADQPHLSREVRALAGVSPGRLAPTTP